MARTPEQKATDEALEEAIDAALAAHDLKRGARSDYLVLAAQHDWDDEGHQTTCIARLTAGDGVPHYRLLGLLDFAATMYRADITTPDQDGDET